MLGTDTLRACCACAHASLIAPPLVVVSSVSSPSARPYRLSTTRRARARRPCIANAASARRQTARRTNSMRALLQCITGESVYSFHSITSACFLLSLCSRPRRPERRAPVVMLPLQYYCIAFHDRARSPSHHLRRKQVLCMPWCPSRTIFHEYTTILLHQHLVVLISLLAEHCSEVPPETPTGFFLLSRRCSFSLMGILAAHRVDSQI